jgi:serine/threonine protein kinase
MAELFLARAAEPQSTFEKLVVVKKILPRYADNPRFVQLFLDEAKLAQSLSHKNIVQVHDVGGSGSEYFFAMEYLHGQDVRSILHRAWRNEEKLPISHAVQIASQVASALHYAHDKRRPDGSLLEIVHRDVSPSNVLVSYDGAVKLVDFGVAKAATRTVKTRTGTLKGKIAYMSPEQAKGAAIDRRSDVFSLGIVLWEMVTTSRLFRGENDLATLQLIINMPIKRPSEERPDCPPELERIILKALAQDPARRYQSANEVARDLEELVRVEQLTQSAAGLSVYMSGLFKAELDSWELARAAGVALGDHLTNVGELTSPISESDFVEPIDSIDLEEEEEEAYSLGAVSGSIDPPPGSPATVPGRRVNTPVMGTPPPKPPDRTPAPQLLRDRTPPPVLTRPTGAIPSAIPQQGSGPIVARTASGPIPQPAANVGSSPVVARTSTAQRGDATARPPPRASQAPMHAETQSSITRAETDPLFDTDTMPVDDLDETARTNERIDPVPRAVAPEPGLAIASATERRYDPTQQVAPLAPPRASQDSSPWPVSAAPGGGLAHGSWPQGVEPVALGAPGEAPFSAEQARRLRKQIAYAGGVLVLLVLIIALATGGGGGGAANADDPPQGSAVATPPADDPPAPPRQVPAVVPIDASEAPAATLIDASATPVPVDAAEEPVTKTTPPVKKLPIKRPPAPPVKKPPIKKFDPTAPLPPR